VADYPLDIYMQSQRGLDVNLYIPSKVSWKQDGAQISLTLSTNYPGDDMVNISIAATAPKEFTINLRVPSWASAKAEASINSKAIATSPAGAYIGLRRQWKNGDTIRLKIPQSFRTEPIDDQHSETVALMRGPLQYIAVNATKEVSEARLVLPANLNPSGPQSFTENYEGRSITFIPLHQIGLEIYTSYFSIA
jgi:hypothetical protein